MGDFNFATWIGNTLSPITVFGVVIGWFPSIAIVLAVVWYMVQLWECGPVTRWRATHRLRRIAKLKIEMARLEALELVAHPKNRVDIAPAAVAAKKILEQAREEAKALVAAAAAAVKK
jgi:hypothetical protein